MSKKFLYSLFVLFFIVSAAGCARCGRKVDNKKPEEISSAVSPVICEKYSQCQEPGQEFQKETCLNDVAAGISARLKEKRMLSIEASMLEGCLKVIKAAPCDILTSPNPPAGCDFLE